MGLFAIAAYLGLVGVVLFAAFRHRRPGWLSGVVFAFLLLTLPLWIWLLIWLVTPWLPPPAIDPDWKPPTAQ